ncbi:phage antirepressor KilAC domain-containing protein [Caldifermentibacillus hisashii]|uniref:phage antirepressor KilAC domain-containing protein n=1 Tax=Caldifermentibacillus hisashii TaxID=996558 RepID=UPI0031FBD1CD
MNQLVFIENNRVVTDSLTVAECFNKNHNHVLRDIEIQIRKLFEADEGEWGMTNFGQTQYQHPQNKQFYKKYLLTEEAFTLVVMSYVTPEAMKMKVHFIEEFKRMKQELQLRNQPSYMIEDPIKRAERWIEETKEKQAIQQQLQIAAPKVEMYDLALSAKNAQSMSLVAKTLGIGRNKLFSFLRNQKILRHNNEPYQSYIDRGYFTVRQVPISRTSGVQNKPQTLVTAKGLDFIAKLLKQKEAI